jgi:hypothetical protein
VRSGITSIRERSQTADTAKAEEKTMTTSEAPVAETLAAMTAASLEASTLSARELMLARIAALAAVEAPAVSYALNASTAEEVGLTLADVQGVLVAVAPLIGTPRVVAACVGLTEGLGYVIALEESGAGTG